MPLRVSLSSLSLESSATQGLHPLNQKLTTVTAFAEKMLSSTSLPSRSFPVKPGNGFEFSLTDVPSADAPAPEIWFWSSVISFSIPRIVSMSALTTASSSSVKDALLASRVLARKSAYSIS